MDRAEELHELLRGPDGECVDGTGDDVGVNMPSQMKSDCHAAGACIRMVIRHRHFAE